jgi:hypothetical protein
MNYLKRHKITIITRKSFYQKEREERRGGKGEIEKDEQ